MRALTHISVPAAPDYALRVPSHLQVLVGAGVTGGLVGLCLTSGSATGIDLWKTNAGDQSPEVARRNAHLDGVAEPLSSVCSGCGLLASRDPAARPAIQATR